MDSPPSFLVLQLGVIHFICMCKLSENKHKNEEMNAQYGQKTSSISVSKIEQKYFTNVNSEEP